MALTELQLPSKGELYANLQQVANELKRTMLRLQEASDFIADLDATDLTDIGVPTGQIRTDLIDFRTAINEMISLFNGASVTPTNSPVDIIDLIRQMLPI